MILQDKAETKFVIKEDTRTVRFIDKITGEVLRSGKGVDLAITATQDYTAISLVNSATGEIIFSGNYKLIYNKLKKLFYMKNHVKSKRLKKKYNKAYNCTYKDIIIHSFKQLKGD